jgi:hypothetical protein
LISGCKIKSSGYAAPMKGVYGTAVLGVRTDILDLSRLYAASTAKLIYRFKHHETFLVEKKGGTRASVGMAVFC